MHLFNGHELVRLVLSGFVVACAVPAARLAQRLHHQWRPGQIAGTRAWLHQVPVLSLTGRRALPAVVSLAGARACAVNGFLWPAVAVRRWWRR